MLVPEGFLVNVESTSSSGEAVVLIDVGWAATSLTDVQQAMLAAQQNRDVFVEAGFVGGSADGIKFNTAQAQLNVDPVSARFVSVALNSMDMPTPFTFNSIFFDLIYVEGMRPQ